ncbi:MAG TPA: Xaa-Pro peptidase family protein [Anaerolineales bacterium]|nr:Xaa-Pro peptidase family protein [Anaerolineales bacterium]
MTTTIIIRNRQAKLAHALETAGLEALALNPGPSLVYLTGLHFHLSERPIVVLFAPGKTPAIVLPGFETVKLDGLGFEIEAFGYGEDPLDWARAFAGGVRAAGIAGKRVGVEPRQMRLLEIGHLEEAAAAAKWVPAGDLTAGLRMYKDESEAAVMRAAAQLAEKALAATLPQIRPGIDEKELAGELVVQMLRHGSDPQIPFSPIVAAGPNSANPHATPTDRKIMTGDLLLFDWGAAVDGYFSDITRTFAVGEVEPELAKIAGIVKEANAAARGAAGPGVPMQTVDRAARDVITAAGYGEYFTHRTGHGLGMEGHEEPYIRGDNEQILEPGMTFTIEPGIYLPGRGGVRIEDDVMVTEEGLESFTGLSRELIRLPLDE